MSVRVESGNDLLAVDWSSNATFQRELDSLKSLDAQSVRMHAAFAVERWVMTGYVMWMPLLSLPGPRLKSRALQVRRSTESWALRLQCSGANLPEPSKADRCVVHEICFLSPLA